MRSVSLTLTTGQLARELEAELRGPDGVAITSVAAMGEASEGALTFIRSERFAQQWPACRASAALVSRGVNAPALDDDSRAILVVDDADLALARVLALLRPSPAPAPPGVHPSAVVHPEAVIDSEAHLGPYCLVGAGARVGPGTQLVNSVTLADGVRVGAGCVLHAGVVVQSGCVVGDRCVLHPRVVIGADGFGYRPAPDGSGLVKIPHVGDVRIGSDVEIGAGACVDRGKLGSTLIGDGAKIDNLVQIGHNCVIGRNCIICGLTGLSGSVRLGDGVQLAGGVGVADNIEIGAGARVAAGSGVMNDIPAGESWGGYPAGPDREIMPNYAAFRSLAPRLREAKKLAKRVERLEGLVQDPRDPGG